MVEQGDIITVSDISFPVLVVSKDIYNSTGNALVCPIVSKDPDTPFGYYIESELVKGYACFDNLRMLNISERGAFKKGRVSYANLISILGMIRSLFDY